MTNAAEAPAFEPGVYDITADAYHADPVPGGSLSSTGARRLLAPSCPALFRHEQLHGQAPKKHFDLGTAVHTLALGDGPDLVRIDHPNYQTKAAQQQRDEARTLDQVPLLPHEMQQVQDMTAVLLAHPRAGELLAPGTGEPEQTYLWVDEHTGVACRARPDWANDDDIVDLKTTDDPNPEAIQRAIWKWRYHQQRGWYVDGHRAVIGRTPRFTFIFQGKQPPYLVTVVELDPAAELIGDLRNRQARERYATCRANDTWPDYGNHTHVLALPAYAEKREIEDLEEYLA